MRATAIMAAQRHAYNHRSIGCDPAQSWISGKKPRNALFVVALGNLKALNSLPQLDRGIVIVDRKFSRANRVLHVGANSHTMHRAFLISAFLSCRAPSSELPPPPISTTITIMSMSMSRSMSSPLVLCHSFVIPRQSGSDSDLDA
jgi:hypothetical protein